MTSLPDELIEYHFVLKDGESFKVDAEYVEVEYGESEKPHIMAEVKKWTLSTKTYSREITERDVESVMAVVKDEERDNAKSLISGKDT